MRFDVKKFVFMAIKDIKNAFFEKAQEKGIIDFIFPGPDTKEVPEDIEACALAIKNLRSLSVTEQLELDDHSQADEISHKIISTKHHLEQLSEKERLLELEISRTEVFGDFSAEDIEYISKETGKKFHFFCAKQDLFEEETLPEDLMYLDSGHGLDYFFSINEKTKEYKNMIEMKVPIPVNMTKNSLRKVRLEKEEVENTFKSFQKYNKFLHEALREKLNAYALFFAQNKVSYEIDDSLFVIQGWVPVNKIAELDELVKEFDIHCEEIAFEESDFVPTYLENKGAARMGEDLVHIYDTPSNEDKDPSGWVLVFFALFFSFIVGDGGYGLIFLMVALYIRFKHKNLKNLGKRLLNLTTMLAICCILWGFSVTSFFGMGFDPDSSMQKFSLVNWLILKKTEFHMQRNDATFTEWATQFPQIKNMTSPQEVVLAAYKEKKGIKQYEMYRSTYDGIMLELALLIGMIHVILSFCRNLRRNWTGVGWILFIIGGYCYFPYYLKTISVLNYVFGLNPDVIGPNGLYLMIGGLTIATVLSLIQNKLSGILEIMTVIQVFSDILSYLRLYALGLAGGIVSTTVNDLASSVPFVFGVLIILFGHTVNIALAIMGGVIHGLRLNFLEWYHYSFSGGGKMFKPLRKLEIE